MLVQLLEWHSRHTAGHKQKSADARLHPHFFNE